MSRPRIRSGLLLSSLCLAFALSACGGGGKGKAAAPAPIEEQTPEEVVNHPPIAAAGADRIVPVGSVVELDGRGSSDPDQDALSFRWSFVAVPSGSSATFSNSASKTPRFTADLAGAYEIELLVSDGKLEATDRIQVHGNVPPVAHAGGDRSGGVGEELRLDGRGSSDEDGDELEFDWAFISKPEASTASLSGRSTQRPKFTPDLAGSYVVELAVHDGTSTSRDRANIQVNTTPGFSGSIIHVSPSGSDEGLGLESDPLETIGAALARLRENTEIRRIQLAAGLYEESFDYELREIVEILGPEGEEVAATLRGEGTLFSLAGSARLSLNSLNLETPGAAVVASGAQTTINLNSVSCSAETCVSSGGPFFAAGGRVNVRDSILKGLSTESGSAVSISASIPGAIILDTKISGFQRGINVSMASLLLQDSELSDNSIGLKVSDQLLEAAAKVEVDGCVFSLATIGIDLIRSRDITVRTSSFSEVETGILVNGGSIVLSDLDFVGISGAAIHVGKSNLPVGDVVVLRDSDFGSIAGPNVMIEGKLSSVVLGSQGEPGGNSFHSSYVPIYDNRPVDSSGLITVSASSNSGVPIPPGIYKGKYSSSFLQITNSGNQVIAY